MANPKYLFTALIQNIWIGQDIAELFGILTTANNSLLDTTQKNLVKAPTLQKEWAAQWRKYLRETLEFKKKQRRIK